MELTRAAGTTLLVLLAALVLDVLFEGWVQQIFGHAGPRDAKGQLTWVLAGWPKTVKSALFLAVLAVTLAKVALDRSWRDFATKTEAALVALAMVMVAAGLFGGCGPVLIGQSLFVYFRGVIVFFAWRALRPTCRQLKPIVIAVGVIAVLNASVAMAEFAFGLPVFRALGWTELTWARLARADGFFNHPNHLGHFLMVVDLGLLCWFMTLERVSRKWWLLFGFLAFGLSATQSRESTIGFVLGAAVMWWFRRGSVKPVVIAAVLVLGFAGLQVAIPKNQATVADRLAGVFNAIGGGKPKPSGKDDPAASRQETRIVFFKQGAGLLVRRPLLGYGVGQFGGTVAYQHDPYWYDTLVDNKLDPAHPDFPLAGAHPDQVDSFWLHLTVETGLLGLAFYLLWLYFLISPIVRARQRDSLLRSWAPALIAASVVIAVLSPALEDQLYPVLLFTVLGWAWAAPGAGSPLPAALPRSR
ncbi:O-antigen ligase family protein [Fodinicola feengrottensis]|uniref:O-antigen ligase family protein n=1 Tax=Fodinicola feengrottensis TaxID=435914 RepID=UPI0031D58019